MKKLIKKNTFLRKLQKGGIVKADSGIKTLPIGNQALYDHVVTIYLNLIDKGISPEAALELTNQKIAEKGWTGWATGDNKKYPTVDAFTDHLIDWHGRMYPDSLKATDFNSYWRGILETSKYKYNSENPNYKDELLKTRPGVRKRINYYRQQKGLGPLAYNDEQNNMV